VCSFRLLSALIDRSKIVLIEIRVVSNDLDNLRNKTSARSPLELHDHVHGIADIRLNCSVREVDATLKHAAREPGQSLTRGGGVDRGEAPGMASIQELQQIKRLPSADFTKNDAVGPMAKSGFQKIANTDRRNAVLSLSRFEANQVVVIHVDFGSVFDKQDSFVWRNEFAKDIQKGRFPGSRASRD
jgi:hypothetical protein